MPPSLISGSNAPEGQRQKSLDLHKTKIHGSQVLYKLQVLHLDDWALGHAIHLTSNVFIKTSRIVNNGYFVILTNPLEFGVSCRYTLDTSLRPLHKKPMPYESLGVQYQFYKNAPGMLNKLLPLIFRVM